MSSTETKTETEDINNMELQEEQEYDPTKDQNAADCPPELDADGHAITYRLRLSLGPNKKDPNADLVVADGYVRPEKGMYFSRGKEAVAEFQSLVAQGLGDQEARQRIVGQTMTRRSGGAGEVQVKRFPLFGVVTIEQSIMEGDYSGFQLGRNWPNTIVGRTGTSSFADIMNKAGHPLQRGMNLEQMAQLADYWLGTRGTDSEGVEDFGLIVPARVQWRGYCKTEEKEVKELNGERNWPVRYDADGRQIGHYAGSTVEVDEATGERTQVNVECPNCGAPIVARAQVGQFVLTV